MLTTRYSDNNMYRFKTLEDESGDEQFKTDKDKFIELAQAALEQAKFEEEQKGVLQELFEVFIEQTGAPMVADVILEQFRSQDVIERIAETHFEKELKNKRRSSSSSINSCSSCDSFDNIIEEEEVMDMKEQDTNIEVLSINNTRSIDTIMLISEYLWRFFRLLLLSSIVGLVYHFMCANQPLL